jgi:manganese/iron transport system permease protein
MLVIAVAIAVGSSAVGTVLSFHINGATGACIVLVQFLAFVAALLFAPKRGLIAARWRRVGQSPPAEAGSVR